MRCEEILNHLSAHLEDEIEPTQRRAIQEHLSDCGRCRHELELLRRTVSALKSLEQVEVPHRLTASIEAGVEARGTTWLQRLASRLFFPLHIKLPLEAMALILVALGAVYIYRSAPELAEAPRAPAVSERVVRGRGAGQVAGARQDVDKTSVLRQSTSKTEVGLDDQAEQEALKAAEPPAREEKNIAVHQFGLMRKEAPSAADVATPVWEITLKTENPSEVASRIGEIAESLGGKLVQVRDQERLILTVPTHAYPKFLAALKELGTPVDIPGEAGAATRPTPQETLTLHLRLVR